MRKEVLASVKTSDHDGSNHGSWTCGEPNPTIGATSHGGSGHQRTKSLNPAT